MVLLLWVLALPVVVATQATDTLCPGGGLKCPDHMTCCLLANKQYGCCPFRSAVCCPDHVHCCPENMACDVIHQACLKKGFPVTFFWQVKVHAELLEEVKQEAPLEARDPIHLSTNHLQDLNGFVNGNTCPDGHRCPGSYTCCKMYRGDYGCCPYRNAQCCSDGFHCCPSGSKCDITSGGCSNVKTNITVKAATLMDSRHITKTRARSWEISDPGGKCPDGHPCPEKFTCCKVQDGGFGCCPYSDARCCTDLIHCCPHGINCNTSTGTCDVPRSSWSVPSYSLLTHKLTEVSVKLNVSRSEPNEVCPDRHSECPVGNTCCPMKDRTYGCCPMSEATCCSDHLHCCPKDYQCSMHGCYRGEEEDNFMQPSPLSTSDSGEDVQPQNLNQVNESTQVEDVVCPDHRSRCPDGNTCCELGAGADGWGCCPMPQATCCGDERTCCPHGYWCSDEGCDRMPGTSLNLLPRLDKMLISNSTKAMQRFPVEVLLP